MEPELCQAHNASDSPAKRRKSNFNTLLTFWGGGLGKENKHTHSKKITDNTQTLTQTFSESNPVIVDNEKTRGGCPADVELEGGGRNQSQLSFCLKR